MMNRPAGDRLCSTQGMFLLCAIGLLVAEAACTGTDLSKQHAERCRLEARTIVHDHQRWQGYLTLAEANDARDFNNNKGIVQILQQIPPSFNARFKRERTNANERRADIVRNDAKITFKGTVIATLINYNATIPSIGTTHTPSCTSIMPTAYIDGLPRRGVDGR